jgi:uncharacterized membrane protein
MAGPRGVRAHGARPTGRASWLVHAAAAGLGVLTGVLLTDDGNALARLLPSDPWASTVRDARQGLTSLFGAEAAIFGLMLTLSALAFQTAVGQFSARLLPIYPGLVSVRRALPVFVFSAAFSLTALRQLGAIADQGHRPRPVMSFGFALLALTGALLVRQVLATLRHRSERVLEVLADLAIAADARAASRRRREGTTAASREEARVGFAAGAVSLRARARGYVADVDLLAMAREARRLGVRARVDRRLGDFVAEGEIVGLAAPERAGAPLDAIAARRLVDAIVLAPAREPADDAVFALQLLTDAAVRALSPGVNDPCTACQAIDHARAVLRRFAAAPPADDAVRDADGAVRVLAARPTLAELCAAVVDGPARYGAADPDVQRAIVELALSVRAAARDGADRALLADVARRALARAEATSTIADPRIEALRARAGPPRARRAA